MIGVRARLDVREEKGRLELAVRPVSSLLFAILGGVLLLGLIVGGGAAGAWDPAHLPGTLLYILCTLFIVGTAGFRRVIAAQRSSARLYFYTRLFGFKLSWGMREYRFAELREVLLERITLYKPIIGRGSEQWEHELFRRPAELHRLALRLPSKRIVVAESSAREDLETAASYWAEYVGKPLQRRER